MGPDGSLPLSQALATCRYPDIKSIQAIPLHSSSCSSNILSSHLSLGLSSGFFLSGLPIKTFYAYLLSPIHGPFPSYLILDLITQLICDDEYKS